MDSDQAYLSSLITAICYRTRIHIAVVGANDGKINDPIYEFGRKYYKNTRIILIEPQSYLVPILEANYSFHPHKSIINCAVGPNGFLTLYSVNESIWKDLDVWYATGWPEYRAPTGVTSAKKQHVQKWLQRHYNGQKKVQDVIVETTVASKNLGPLLESVGIKHQIDVLQVDAEGYDDEVIYNSNIEYTIPKIIYFEAENLSSDKFKNLKTYLQLKGYEIFELERDALATLKPH